MKTIIREYPNRPPDTDRLSDKEAAMTVGFGIGWKYCPKDVWRKRRAEEKAAEEEAGNPQRR